MSGPAWIRGLLRAHVHALVRARWATGAAVATGLTLGAHGAAGQTPPTPPPTTPAPVVPPAGPPPPGQVGSRPSRSPFADLLYRQAFSFTGGYFHAARDPAGVAPQSGPMVGLQYDLGGGPAIFTTRVRTVLSDRTVLDPARPVSTRVLGTARRPLTMADLGLTLALTGARTYHGIVPLVHVGGGVATTFGGTDPGGFTFGTSFALSYGLGLRYVSRPASRYALRVDLGNTLYRVRYPATYAQISTGYGDAYAGTADSSSIIPANAALSRYRNNTALTIGVSYQFHR